MEKKRSNINFPLPGFPPTSKTNKYLRQQESTPSIPDREEEERCTKKPRLGCAPREHTQTIKQTYDIAGIAALTRGYPNAYPLLRETGGIAQLPRRPYLPVASTSENVDETGAIYKSMHGVMEEMNVIVNEAKKQLTTACAENVHLRSQLREECQPTVSTKRTTSKDCQRRKRELGSDESELHQPRRLRSARKFIYEVLKTDEPMECDD